MSRETINKNVSEDVKDLEEKRARRRRFEYVTSARSAQRKGERKGGEQEIAVATSTEKKTRQRTKKM